MPAVLVLLGGTVELRSVTGGRDVAAGDFFVGPMESATRPDELAVAVTFQRPPHGTGSAFVELARRHGDYAMCGVCAVVGTDAEDSITSARVALISAGAGPVLVDVTEAITGSGGAFDEAALIRLVDERIDPEDDIHASAEYRRHLAHVLTRRALGGAREHALRRRSEAKEA